MAGPATLTPEPAISCHRSPYSGWMTGVMASGSYPAAVPLSSPTRTGARRLITTPSTGMRASSSMVSRRASTRASRVVSASISARRSLSMPRSSAALTCSARIACTCCKVKPRSFSAMTRFSSASCLAW